MTVTVPTTIIASNQHNFYSKKESAQPLQKQLAPWQRGYLFAKNQQLELLEDAIYAEQGVTGATKPLRKKPLLRISIRRRITDTLNSPFEYEMSEAARVVL